MSYQLSPDDYRRLRDWSREIVKEFVARKPGDPIVRHRFEGGPNAAFYFVGHYEDQGLFDIKIGMNELWLEPKDGKTLAERVEDKKKELFGE